MEDGLEETQWKEDWKMPSPFNSPFTMVLAQWKEDWKTLHVL